MSDLDQPDRDEDHILAGEYALGLLSAEEAAAFEARMVREPGLRAAYAQWATDLAALTDDVAPQPPPAHVWRRLEAGLFPDTRRARWPRRLVVWGGGLAAAAVLALAVVIGGNWGAPPQTPAEAIYRAEVAAEDRSLVVEAVYDAATGTLLVDRAAGAPAPGRALELWLIADEDAPVSLGVLPEDRRGTLPVPDALRPRLPGAVLAVSDEPSGGSPTGAPTGDVLATGAVRDS
ncbi:anti-sigma factor [Roseovarius ramblicola]|uniref:Anti-sigma factor domain-containing protein n=1 Tax=Roseovarius ramblicola TaxID=2022336 RepID=A0ABV5I498_9RHOB